MQENTKHEFARIDAENKAERFRMQLESQQAMDVLRIQMSQLIEANKAMQASQADTNATLYQPLPPQPLPPVVATPFTLQPPLINTQVSDNVSTPTAPVARAVRVISPPRNPLPADVGVQGRANAGLSLDGQPPQVSISPEEIATQSSPIRSLRRNEPTSTVAELVLSEIGLAKMIELDKSSKKDGTTSKLHKLKNRDAKWPNDYIIRFDDNDPKYDTLNETEFVSGYLSIMEEVTPVIPQNAKLLSHLDYLRQLMDDCGTMDWSSVREAHRHVLTTMELHRLKWENTQAVKETKTLAIARLRNRADQPSNTRNATQSTHAQNSQAQPCNPYQKLTCTFSDEHTSEGVTRLHCCAYCFRKTGAEHPHPHSECRKCNRGANRPKNGKPGSSEK